MKTKLQNIPGSDNGKIGFSNSLETCQMSLLPVGKKPVTATFTEEKISSDGGLLMLREVENQVGLIADIVSVIEDQRDSRYVDHSLLEIVSQRVFQIAAGYEDTNDCNSLRDDPVFKMCARRLPEQGAALASQPTMSRFENSVTRSELYRIAEVFVEHFIGSYSTEPPVIVIDCDDTNNNAHGGQQMTLFNNYYREYCYMPLHIYEGLSGKLITTILKPGRMSKAADVFAILRRVISLIREQWKNTVMIVRGDSHFTSHPLMDWSEDQPGVHFVTGLISNKVLKRNVEGHLKTARALFERKAKMVKLYHSFSYQAKSWKHPQRVIAKVEYGQQGANIRYVVSDLQDYRARDLYEKGYCGRGRMELNIKDHKTYLKSDRSSCHRFEANQLRLFLHSAAYVLIHSLKTQILKGTSMARSTIETIRLKLFKVALKVKEYKTRIKLEFPSSVTEKDNLITVFEILRVLRC